MDEIPSSPWLESITGGSHGQVETPYDGTYLQQDADLYHAGAQLGFSPLDIDEMELWQLAAAFGSDYERPEKDDGGQGRPNQPVSSKNKRDLLAERVAHHKGDGPKPEADKAKPDADVLNLMNTIRGG